MTALSRFAESTCILMMRLFGHHLARKLGNVKLAHYLLVYAMTFNTRGAAILFPQAPWFNTNGPDDEDDCVDHTMNTDPVDYFRRRNCPPWWERLEARWQRLRNRFRDRCRRQKQLPTQEVSALVVTETPPAVELDPYRCSED